MLLLHCPSTTPPFSPPPSAGQAKYTPVDLNTSSLKMYWNLAKRSGGQEWWRKLLSTLKGVADKHNATSANVALAWVMQQGKEGLVSPLVGVRGVSHIQDNAKAIELRLDGDDLAAIEAVLAEGSPSTGDCYSFERGG